MIVDCHTHLDFQNDNDGSLLSEFAESSENVDSSIILANLSDDVEQANVQLVESLQKQSHPFVGFGIVNPLTIDRKFNLDASIVKQGLKGIVMYCCEHAFHPCHSRAMIVYEQAEQLGLPVFFHSGQDLPARSIFDYAQPVLLDEIARTFSDLKIIVGNMGHPFTEQTIVLLRKHPNVYGDLTIYPGHVWQVYNTVLRAHESGVMSKLVFGSGFPTGRANQCIETLLGFNKMLGDTNLPVVPRGEIRNIIERDSLTLLGIQTN